MALQKRILSKLVLILSFFVYVTCCCILQAQAMDRSVIIGFHKKTGSAEEDLIHKHGGGMKRKFRHIAAYAADLPDYELEKLRKNPNVKYIVEDMVYSVVEPVASVAADPLEYANSWGVERIGSMTAHVNAITGKGVRIAVLDSGIDYTHQEFSTSYSGGWDFVFNDDDPFDDSWNSHGTHVAGIIAAAADGSGVVGVAPGAELYAIKVLDGGGFGLLSWIISGIEWAIDNDMDVVNISIGGPHIEALQDACDAAYNAGVLLVAAAGNGTTVGYPAAYDSVIAVTGTDNLDQPGWFAPTGSLVELAAPGVAVYSSTADNSYTLLSGTSQAAPHVSGAAALLLSVGMDDVNGDGLVNNMDVRGRLQMSAQDLGDPGQDDVYGHGLIDVVAALSVDSDIGFSFDLVREKKRRQNREVLAIEGGTYLFSIANHSLRGLKVVAYEDGYRRFDLDQHFVFRPKTQEEASFSLDTDGTALDVMFLPIGRAESSATVTVNNIN